MSRFIPLPLLMLAKHGLADAGMQAAGEGARPNTCKGPNTLTGPKKYSTKTAEAFVSCNGPFIFARDELKQRGPEMFSLLAKHWGVLSVK